MPYSIERYNGTTVAVVEDGTINDTLSIKLIGKNYAGYGEVQNENFLYLLENFSGTTPPLKPISGQIWFDAASKKLKFYDDAKWKTTGGAEVSETAPVGLGIGDFWYDELNNKLFAWNGSNYVLIGPQSVTGRGTTRMESVLVYDIAGSSHAIIKSIVNEVTVYVISATSFRLSDTTPIDGFTDIHQGLTLRDTDENGDTYSYYRHWGTATNSDRLGGIPASSYMSSDNARFTSVVRFSDEGFTVGNQNDLEVFISNNDKPIIRNGVGNTITFQTKEGNNIYTPLKLENNNIIPGMDNISDIGTPTLKYANIYATYLDGISEKSNTLVVDGEYRLASTNNTPYTIAARDVNGSIKAELFDGTAARSLFADLAEKYLPDTEYDVGTVVKIGGEKEITATMAGDRAIGAISQNPAFMMNKELTGGVYVALKGRLPIKVKGKVNKGDQLIAFDGGCAISTSYYSSLLSNVFAIAIESSDDENVKLIEALIL